MRKDRGGGATAIDNYTLEPVMEPQNEDEAAALRQREQAARLMVTSHAKDPRDAALLLLVLGLNDATDIKQQHLPEEIQ